MEKTVEKNNFNGDFRLVYSLVLLTCTLWIFKLFWEQLIFIRKARVIPNAQTGPLGAIGDMIGQSFNGCFHRMLRYFETGPDIFKIWYVHVLVVGVSKPEHLEIVMTNPSCLGKSPIIEYTKPYMGHGLLTAPVNIWKKNRKLINKAFNYKLLNSFIPMFAEKCDHLIDTLEKIVGQPDIDVMDLMTECTLDAVCESAIGLNLDTQTSSRYRKLLDKLLRIFMIRLFTLYLYPDIVFYSSWIGKRTLEIVKELNHFSRRVITQRRVEFKQTEQDYCDQENQRLMKSFMEILLDISQKEKHFSDQQILDEVNTMLAAGSDTTATALSFCCLTLGLHPAFQQKMYEEAIDVLGEDRYATEKDLPNLKFTELIIKETMRIFPVVPILIRVAADDIKIDDTLIPKDAIFMMGMMHLHRSPKYWKDPLEFNPYRFLPEEWAKQHPYSFLPFSGGPRNCMGRIKREINTKYIYPMTGTWFKDMASGKYYFLQGNSIYVQRNDGYYSKWVTSGIGEEFVLNDKFKWTWDKQGRLYPLEDDCPAPLRASQKFGIPIKCLGGQCPDQARFPSGGMWHYTNCTYYYECEKNSYQLCSNGFYKKWTKIPPNDQYVQICPDNWTFDTQTGSWEPVPGSGSKSCTYDEPECRRKQKNQHLTKANSIELPKLAFEL